jgi:alpha-L-glutamate ligase-like protein
MAKWRFWAWPSELRRCGVLGINARNAELLAAGNPRSFLPRVDDKAVTKALCRARGIPVPETYAVVERFGDIRRLDALGGDRHEFVIKPARGAGGRGIQVIVARDGDSFRTGGGVLLAFPEVRYHLAGILAGLYSLGGRPDKAILEERIHRHPIFETMAVGGTPDIRVVVYRNMPAMAMLRLPTSTSGGRANLHQGAVGVGIDLDGGRTSGGVWQGRRVAYHPETGAPLGGVEVPHWETVLSIASELGGALGLNYVGVDIVLDPNRGPVVLEANARPGLVIQIANEAGLWQRLREIDALLPAGRCGRAGEVSAFLPGTAGALHEQPGEQAARAGERIGAGVLCPMEDGREPS